MDKSGGFIGKHGRFEIGTMGELVRAQPTRERCERHNRGWKCRCKVQFYWRRDGKRDAGLCTEHAREAFPEAFGSPEGA